MSDINDCILELGGMLYGGWTDVDIQTGLEQIGGGFSISLTQRWPGVDVPQDIREGAACKVRLGDDVVINGYVDVVDIDCDATSTQVKIEGRDRAGDLVDCSAIHKTGQWHGVRLEQIVADIAAPFGISVAVDAGVSTGDVFTSFALDDGETAFSAIDRACRLRAVLVVSTADGNLLLTQASTTRADVALVEGVNMERMRATHSWRERHSVITLTGQVPGNDDTNGPEAAHIKRVAADEQITRYRPLIVIAEHGTSAKAMADRAAWEVKARMGRGKRGSTQVVGWRTGADGQTGALWRYNMLLPVTSARLGLDMDMLIVSCHDRLGERGRTCDLTFARPEAFALTEGVGRSKLTKKLNDKTQAEKHKKGDKTDERWAVGSPGK